VVNPRPLISSPGRIIARDPVSLTVSLPEPGEYVVRVRWSRYLFATAGCMRPAEGGWSSVVPRSQGRQRSRAVSCRVIVDAAAAARPRPGLREPHPPVTSRPATCCDGAIDRRMPASACGIIIAIIRVEQSCRSRELGRKTINSEPGVKRAHGGS
jgi:hypothetical protein